MGLTQPLCPWRCCAWWEAPTDTGAPSGGRGHWEDLVNAHVQQTRFPSSQFTTLTFPSGGKLRAKKPNTLKWI